MSCLQHSNEYIHSIIGELLMFMLSWWSKKHETRQRLWRLFVSMLYFPKRKIMCSIWKLVGFICTWIINLSCYDKVANLWIMEGFDLQGFVVSVFVFEQTNTIHYFQIYIKFPNSTQLLYSIQFLNIHYQYAIFLGKGIFF